LNRVQQLLTRLSRIATGGRARLAEAERSDSKLRLALPGAVALRLDAKGVALAAGPGGADLFGVDAESLIGQTFPSRVHVGDRPEFLCALSDALREGEARVSFRLRATADADAQTRFIVVEADLRRDEGAPSTVLSKLRDIDELASARKSIEAVQRESVAALTLKDRLLANVTHELRTPLNAILGFSEILGDLSLAPPSAEKRVEYARIIHTSAEHLLSVVNLLLDTSRLEVGRFQLTPEPFALAPLIASCSDMLRLKAEAKGVVIEAPALDPSIELHADKRACRQILLNLLSNAVKFSKAGGRVEVETRIVEPFVEISVLDRGVGIDSQHLPRVGDPFFQARAGYDRPAEGAGLGLSLVRGLIALHSGGLTIESAPDVGTRATMRLPLEFEQAPTSTLAGARFETVPTLSLAPLSETSTEDRAEERRFA